MNLTQNDFLGEYDSPSHEPEWFSKRENLFKDIARMHLMAMSESDWLEIRQEALADRFRFPGTDDMADVEILAMSREEVLTQGCFWAGCEMPGIAVSAVYLSTIGTIEGKSVYYDTHSECYLWAEAETREVVVISLRFPLAPL